MTSHPCLRSMLCLGLLLAAPRAALSQFGEPAEPSAPRRISYPAVDAKTYEAASAILQALDRPVTIDITQTPLSDVMDRLEDSTGLAIVIDQRALDDLGIDASTQVSLRIGPIRLRSALKLMLKALDLTWQIDADSLVITTRERAEEELAVRVYPIRDLALTDHGHEIVEDYDEIVDAITSTVAPDSWETVGGPGSVQPLRNSGVLLVSQTWEVHERVEGVLTTLRRVRRAQGIRSIVPEAQWTSDFSTEPDFPAVSPAPLRRPAGAANAFSAGWQVPRMHQPSE